MSPTVLSPVAIVQYAAADAFAYTAPVIDSRHRNRMVRGEHRHRAAQVFRPCTGCLLTSIVDLINYLETDNLR